MFEHLQAYCMFVGYPRSGHTLVGSLLDAHEHIIIAQELDSLLYVGDGIGREQLFESLLEYSQQFSDKGRKWSGYKYEVPGQWHSRASELRVIGDKKGGGSTNKLSRNPALLDQLRELVDLPLRLVHVVRNPYDTIATMMRRRKPKTRTLNEIVAQYFALAASNAATKKRVDPNEFCEIHHEDLIADPKECVAKLVRYLGLEPSAAYLEACASIVYASPHRSRFDMEWPEDWIERVAELAAPYDFLRDYTFEEEASQEEASLGTDKAPASGEAA